MVLFNFIEHLGLKNGKKWYAETFKHLQLFQIKTYDEGFT